MYFPFIKRALNWHKMRNSSENHLRAIFTSFSDESKMLPGPLNCISTVYSACYTDYCEYACDLWPLSDLLVTGSDFCIFYYQEDVEWRRERDWADVDNDFDRDEINRQEERDETVFEHTMYWNWIWKTNSSRVLKFFLNHHVAVCLFWKFQMNLALELICCFEKVK